MEKQKYGRGGYIVKRFFAYLIDWYLASTLLNFIVAILSLIFVKELKLWSFRELMEANLQYILIIACFISFTVYFILIPYVSKKKQTVMMRMFKLELARIDDKEITLLDLIIRYFIGGFLLQFVLYSESNLLWATFLVSLPEAQSKTINMFGLNAVMAIIILNLGLGIIDKNKTRTIQDRISKTYIKDIHDYSKPLRAL